ncbi:hypothetical protein KTO58_12015 [Chitinophaga pendula]|uniref:hypothetical protein n=1 Tax=Chitinophaga TaxID=79328 RepID=UPI000BB01BEB|nr:MULTISPECIES: hypothetical protein [Chitinophaga]ASZ12510.1 hypothetical protein CK934_16870 [Chitinophaga sp. MD30]UCJ09887.1 hypothetical protein KTO58_12015 [Chitinophaga pendula]
MPEQHRQNIYELRSSAVQEVLRKPPAFLIVWANITIIVIIAVGFLLLSVITLPADANAAYQLKEINRNTDSAGTILLSTSLSTNELQTLRLPAKAYLYPGGEMLNNSGVFTCKVDTAYRHMGKVYLRAQTHTPAVFAFPTGRVRVAGPPESLLQRFFKKIHL